MTRRAAWWVAEHRRQSAVVALALCALAAIAVLSSGTSATDASERQLEPSSAIEVAQVRDFIEEAQESGAVEADPDAQVRENPTIKERIEAAEESGENPETGGKLERVPEPSSCSRETAGAIVDVSASGPISCAGVEELVGEYRSGLGAGQLRALGEFACAPSPQELQVTCTRVADAATVVLLFGPGGPGLTDCGHSPIDEDANLARVRASGLGCNDARTKVFAAMSAGEPSSVKGLRCAERSVAAVATVSCEGGDETIAFTLP